MLSYVHEQAVHEAGHAVAACLLKIRFSEVKLIYDAGVDFAPNRVDDTCGVPYEQRPNFRLAYAAGAAAEDVVFSARAEWRCTEDRRLYDKCGGNDFEEDARKVRQVPGFNSDVLTAVASLLERRHCLPMCDDQLAEVLRNHQICIWWPT